MRNGVDYTKKDEVIMHALSKGSSSDSFLQHTDSTYGYSDVAEKLGPLGFYFAQVSDVWQVNYSLFASKNQDKVKKLEELNEKSWNDVNGTKDQMYKAVLSECCAQRLEKDREIKVNPARRLSLQMIDLIRQDYINPLDLFEDMAQLHSKREKSDDDKDSFSEIHERNRQDLKDVNESMFLEDLKSGLLVSAMNLKLSNEFPMCKPGCREIFNNYTMPRLRAMKELGYQLGTLSYNLGDYIKNVFFSHYWGEKNNSVDEIDKMIGSVELGGIKNITDMERSRVGDDIVNLKRKDEIILTLTESATIEENGIRFKGKVEL